MISVLIPVYNAEKYLHTCVESLLCQTHQDIEYVFVNDASTDTSLKILEKYRKQYPDKIRIINSNKHINLGGARNLGIKAARGEYIGFVDSDDFIAPNMYKKLYEAITTNKADAAFSLYTKITNTTDYESAIITPQEMRPGIAWDKHLIQMSGRNLDEVDSTELLVYPIGDIWTGLWKKAVILNNNIWWPRLRYEDNYWASLIYCYLKKVVFVEEILYFHRIHSESMTQKRNQPYTFERIQIERNLLKEVKRRGFYEKYYAAWEYTYANRYVYNTFYILMNNWDEIPNKQLSEIARDIRMTFPNWFKNIYFKKLCTREKKAIILGIVYMPRLTAKLYKSYRIMYRFCLFKSPTIL